MTHHRVASITGGLDRVVQCIHDSDPDTVDLLEVRLDALWNAPPASEPETEAATDALLRITQAAQERGVHLLATLRPKRQGGAYEGPEDVRLSLLAAAARAGFHAVDLESDNQDPGALVQHFRDEADLLVLSDHSLPATPSRDDGLLRLLAMQDAGADMEKLAFPVGSFSDTLRAIELVHGHAARTGRPAIAPIGASAQVRALLAVLGNRATYGHATGAPPAVSGQPALADMQATWDHWGLAPDELGPEGGRPWLAVFGTTVAHSLSPRIHNAALRSAGRPERFVAFDVPDSLGAMRLLSTVAPRLGIVGASVTNPLKQHAAAVADCDDRATLVGAANCIRYDATQAGPTATNTDASALERMLAAHDGSSVAVLGAGGAARAALQAAKALGRDAAFTSRDPVRAAEVSAALDVPWTPWDDRATLSADVWVQATPIGSRPDDPSPLPGLDGAAGVVEMVYAAGPTRLEQDAKAAGLRVDDGKRLLLEQAVDAYRYWFHEEADRAAMEAALA